MKRRTFILYIFCMLLISCDQASDIGNESSSSESSGELAVRKIELAELDDSHPNKTQFEWFLNNYKEVFTPTAVLKRMDTDTSLICDFRFVTESKSAVELYFFETQLQAISNIALNEISTKDTPRDGVNGAVHFRVDAQSEAEKSNLLSWFSGEE